MDLGDGRSFAVLVSAALAGALTLSSARPEAPAQPAAGPGAGTPLQPGGHATPPGWQFTWPVGDPARGRAIFVKLECYSCHEVKGEPFPIPRDGGWPGPELAAMGSLHPPEYFAEAVINPSAVIDPGRAYAAPDGSSRMPSYNDVVTVQEVVDLVAYLRALRPPAGSRGGPPGGHDGHH
jgi:hypothetical protein